MMTIGIRTMIGLLITSVEALDSEEIGTMESKDTFTPLGAMARERPLRGYIPPIFWGVIGGLVDAVLDHRPDP